MKKNLSACTTVLVGRNATIDGSTMAARNDDTFAPLTPQRFVTYPAYHNHPNQVKAYLNKCVIDRPADGYRYQAHLMSTTKLKESLTKVVLMKRTLG